VTISDDDPCRRHKIPHLWWLGAKKQYYSVILSITAVTCNLGPRPSEYHNFLPGRQTRRAEQATLQTTWAYDQTWWTKKNRIKNFHKLTIKMILFASTEGYKTVPAKPVESCNCFMNCKTVVFAEQALNSQFESKGIGKVSFSSGYMANMYLGIILWSSSNTPSNQSPFSLSKLKPIRALEQENHKLTLQLILTQGWGMTIEEIKASNKQEVYPPMNFHKLLDQLTIFVMSNNIFFGKFSIRSQSSGLLLSQIKYYKITFKAMECLKKEFPSKFLLAVNKCYQAITNPKSDGIKLND
jgi:hypothetical protein